MADPIVTVQYGQFDRRVLLNLHSDHPVLAFEINVVQSSELVLSTSDVQHVSSRPNFFAHSSAMF